MSKSQFLIGAAASACGKTTLTLGLLRAFARRGKRVRPFKCGPDYIDPQFHRLAAGTESINLDPFMASKEHLQTLYARYGAEADICAVEGAMGLFDGYDRDHGSAAEVARKLRLPVVLVADARATAFSTAPLLYGFSRFDPTVEVAGVIFNRVASPSHYAHLKAAAEAAGIEPLGYLPRDERFQAPSRHLGLSLEALRSFEPVIDAVADAAERTVNLDRLEAVTKREFPEKRSCEPLADRKLKIAVARDDAFNFTYRANLDRLAETGELTFFSPMNDTALPQADLLYLPGGYPEFHLERLQANDAMRRAIADYVERGGRTLAECGGMMYLCREIRDEAGRPYEMCGVLPLAATLEGMRLHLGLREVRLGELRLRGHEFHYSRIEGEYPSAARQFSARGEAVATPVYRYKRLLAGYTHLYWAETDPLKLFE
ncbi:MAG: cobyrinate a,c-diamide synthase [Alistipes sp.]|nr:cobyrinate a,c-diamide synthase [Alistipes sp.]